VVDKSVLYIVSVFVQKIGKIFVCCFVLVLCDFEFCVPESFCLGVWNEKIYSSKKKKPKRKRL
jgi:hypothetical protein